MTQTENLKLNLYETTDKFTLDVYNDNFRQLDSASGGFSFAFISKSDYDALTEKGTKTLYFVENNGKIEMYLGEIKLSGSGNVPVNTSVYVGKTLVGTVSTITTEEI